MGETKFDKIIEASQCAMETVGQITKDLSDRYAKIEEVFKPYYLNENIGKYLDDLEVPVNPLIQLTEDLLEESKKLNSQITSLQTRINELETKVEADQKRKWKHDLFIAFVSAGLGFLFSFLT